MGSVPVRPDVLRRMCNSLVHRGPDDDAGHLIGGNAALGMRRLSVIDIAHGKHPTGNQDGSVAVVYNGEISTSIEPNPEWRLLDTSSHLPGRRQLVQGGWCRRHPACAPTPSA